MNARGTNFTRGRTLNIYDAMHHFLWIREVGSKVSRWSKPGVLSSLVQVMAKSKEEWKSAESIYDFSVKDIDGNEVSLEKYRNQVVLIVNVASKWGFTEKNYTQLQTLHEKYAEGKGLRILGFPCNQFGSQEPGSEEEIKKFVTERYGVKFDMFSKIDVNGNNAHPLYKYLKAKQGGTLGDFIKWNFTKFLVNREGKPVKRYAPNTEPLSIEKDFSQYWWRCNKVPFSEKVSSKF